MKLLDMLRGQVHQRRMVTTHSEEMEEIASLLAAGLLRLLERKSSQKSSSEAETLLDCGALSEGHVQQKREDQDP